MIKRNLCLVLVAMLLSFPVPVLAQEETTTDIAPQEESSITAPSASAENKTQKPAKALPQASEKAAGSLYVMLDAGHYGYYNQSPVFKPYWESKMTWTLHLYLKEELEKYKNVVVGTTRNSQEKDRPIYERGQAAATYDLFLSLHSNAAGSKTADYPLIITQKDQTKHPLAVSLAKSIKSEIQTKQNYQIWQRLDSTGAEYYGVLRGAKSVGTDGMIVEHSFHTNLTAATWLYEKENLRKLAKAEASKIADYYHLSQTATSVMPPSKTMLRVRAGGYNGLKLNWKKSANASGYQIFRATSPKGTYKKIKTITKPTALSYTNKGLTTGNVYYYKIKAYRKVSGKLYYSKFSLKKSAKVRLSTPSASSKAGHKAVRVSWRGVGGASGYQVYRATSKAGRYHLIKTTGKRIRSYRNSKLKSKKVYYYKVRAYRIKSGKKLYSSFSKRTFQRTK